MSPTALRSQHEGCHVEAMTGVSQQRTMPCGVKLPMSAWADCQFGGISDCGGVSS